MLAPTLLCALAAAGPSNDGLAAVRAVLQRTQGASSARDDVLVRRLVALGPGAAGALFLLVTGEGVEALFHDDAPEAWLCPPDRVGELALEALADLPQVPVEECLRAAAAAHPEREVRTAAFQVLGRAGSADGLDLYFQLLQASAAEIELRSLRVAAQEALRAILRADARTARALATPLASAPLPQQILVCEALGSANHPDAVTLLLALLGRDKELDLAAVESLAALAEAHPWRGGGELLPRLRAGLERADPRLRAAAARALGRLRDPQAVPALIEHLGDAEADVARAALWALRQTSGQVRLTTGAEWQLWLEAEKLWWKQEGRQRLAALERDDPSEWSGLLRALVAHPLGREQVTDVLLSALARLTPEAQVLGCSALVQLGARRAVPNLVELLFEENADVRQAAWKALRALTGKELPAEPRLWEEYAFG